MRRRSGALESATPEEFVKVDNLILYLLINSLQLILLNLRSKNITQI